MGRGGEGVRLLRRSSLIVWLPVVAAFVACEPSGGPASPPLPEPTIGARGPPTTASAGATSFHWPGEHEDSTELSFPSAADAVTFLSRYMNADIALPMLLPSNVRLDVGTSVSVVTRDGVRSAQVKLATEQGDVWGILYGRSGLDGCETGHARSVTVSGEPGLLRVTADPEGSSRKWVELIWPATLKDPEGVYGLFGWLSPSAVFAMAESMLVVDAPPVAAAAAGC
jgi:hypothetical protein